MIPKKIFTTWFSEDPEYPSLVKSCIESQKIPGYEHRVITLADAEKLRHIKYVDECFRSTFKKKKWTKLSDYLRIYYVYNEGGIYLDADVEVRPGKNFDAFLNSKAFIGREKTGWLASSVFGAEKGSPLLKAIQDESEAKFRGDDDKVFESKMEIMTNHFYKSDSLILSREYFQPYCHEDGSVLLTENSVCYHHFMMSWVSKSPSLTFVIPTLGREEGLKRCIESIKRLNYPQDKIEIIVKQDSFENRIGVPKLLKQGVEEAKGEWVIFASNDIEFPPESINQALAEGDGGFVSFNTGPLYWDKSNCCEHFMIRKDIIKKIGEVFDTGFYHCGCDNLLWAKMTKLGIARRAEEAVVKHYHFVQTGEPQDDVSLLAYSRKEEDRALLKVKLAELNV